MKKDYDFMMGYMNNYMFINEAISNLEEYLKNNKKVYGQYLYVFYDVDEGNFYTDNGYTEKEMSESVFTVLTFDNVESSISDKQQIEKIRKRLFNDADRYNENSDYM